MMRGDGAEARGKGSSPGSLPWAWRGSDGPRNIAALPGGGKVGARDLSRLWQCDLRRGACVSQMRTPDVPARDLRSRGRSGARDCGRDLLKVVGGSHASSASSWEVGVVPRSAES
jgi:hypothetical protein